MNIINYLISFPIYELIYGLLLVWFIASAYCIGKLWRDKDISKCNLHFYDSIPTGFTTLGVLGTFIGIFTGLQGFDVNQINESIPQLLYGLKKCVCYLTNWHLSLLPFQTILRPSSARCRVKVLASTLRGIGRT